ncbi:hypothetical protein [Leisingera sp. ANG-M7]|uniref:hypothetical protein n=1 Tax=Leisingera sp. ANG-M7 TaxID=1577902 RepID=UPI00057D51B1|nr:hypothetical protein [Leisingera sp. ANG-M7]KIC35725.1 hypothetical protein RA26_15595 [Leisingera sp. ANG-M7]
MAAQGLGRAVLRCFLGDPDLRVVRTGGVISEAGQDIWLVINRDLADFARVRCVAEAVAAAIEARRGLIEGRECE